MSYLGNDAINRVNLHTTIQALAQGAGGVFVFVYLLKAGVPTPWVFGALAGITISRFVLRPIVLVAARALGVRATLVAGTVLEAAIFPMLPSVHGPGGMLLLVILVSAFGSVFYWTSLHTYTAGLGDAEHRGGQVALGAAGAAAANIVAPWAGGWALGALGPAPTFGVVAVVQVLAILPLLGAPNPRVVETPPPGGWRAARLAVVLSVADGWFAAGFDQIWQIALFVALGEHFAGYGGAMAIAGVVGVVSSLAVGRFVDLGHGGRSVFVAYGVCALDVVLKAASLHSPGLAVLANALATVAAMLLQPVMWSRLYNLAKASPCPLRFHMATEGGWDIGCCAASLTAAALTAAHVPISVPILLALAGAAVGAWLLTHSYRSLET